MATNEKSCKICNAIYEGKECPNCGSKEYSEGYKGKIEILDPENSEIAKQLNLQNKGTFAIKT